MPIAPTNNPTPAVKPATKNSLPVPAYQPVQTDNSVSSIVTTTIDTSSSQPAAGPYQYISTS